jgi:hypothetical protein
LALDDFEDRFATAVKLALDASRASGDDKSDADDGAECPSADAIASYYEYALNRAERARLETHFSGCARCQGTLAALLRAAPTVDTASDAGGFAAAASRRAASESTGIRERWFEIRPAWRIAGTTAAAAAMLAVAVLGGVHVYRGRMGRESEPVAALSAARPLHRNESHPSSSDNELALNELKSSVPAAPATPKAATAPSGAAGAPMRDALRASSGTSAGASAGTSLAAPPAAAPSASTSEATVGSPTSAEAVLPSQEAVPPVAPANTEQNEAAAQAAAALGALAVTPGPAATTAPSIAAPAAAASAATAVTPSVTTPPTLAGATAGESKSTLSAMAAVPFAGAIEAGAAAASIAARNAAEPAATPAAEAAAPAAMAEAPGAAALPATTSKTAASGNSRELANVNEPAVAAGASALSARQRAQEQLKKAQLERAQLAREQFAEEKRTAELARRNAYLKRQMELARRESAASLRMRMAEAPPQAQSAPGGAGNEIAMAEPPVASAPAVATMVRGIPVAPHALLISPADHSIYWSLQNSGVIYRSNDRKSWTPVFTAMPVDLLAGMAPSNTVCWAVGRKGVILLTTDGIHWERVNSPTASDVIGISAASKDVATIFTSSGVTYSTFDGGSNWARAN